MRLVCPNPFLMYYFPTMSLRRSPRLAAKAKLQTPTVQAQTLVPTAQGELYDKHASRSQFLLAKSAGIAIEEAYKCECVNVIGRYLQDVSLTRTSSARAAICISMIRYMCQNPLFLAKYERMCNVVIQKMHELKEQLDTVDLAIREDFLAAADDLLYIIA